MRFATMAEHTQLGEARLIKTNKNYTRTPHSLSTRGRIKEFINSDLGGAGEREAS